jgi:hypothetical protein
MLLFIFDPTTKGGALSLLADLRQPLMSSPRPDGIPLQGESFDSFFIGLPKD